MLSLETKESASVLVVQEETGKDTWDYLESSENEKGKIVWISSKNCT